MLDRKRFQDSEEKTNKDGTKRRTNKCNIEHNLLTMFVLCYKENNK